MGAAPLLQQPINAGRKLRVVCIGAGFSGIHASVYLPQHVPNLELQVYDRADDVGGVWHHNRYAGIACDIPAHSYQLSYADNTQWSKFFAPGGEIQKYLARVADHYGVRKYMKLRHEVEELRWLPDEGKWSVRVQDLVTGMRFEDKADFVAYATGGLSKPVWPKIPGRETYKGVIHHSARWDTAKEEADGMDWSNKTVGVIGVGSSAIQIVPEMQKRAKHVVNFGRSKTWLSGVFSPDILAQLGANTKEGMNHIFSDEEKERLKDPAFYAEFRRMVERDLGSVHYITHQGSMLQTAVRADIEATMRRKLERKPDIASSLIPSFPIGCKRLTPGPGYLDALVADNVTFVSDNLECFTEKGIRTKAGEEFELDAIICATGFDTSSVPAFPIYGTDGVNLQDAWKDEARTYLATTVAGMPNFFSILGTQAGVGSGSLLIVMEEQVAYMAKALNKCANEGYKSLVVKEEAVASFLKYTDAYFSRTTFVGDCRSWYKNGKSGAAKIRTLWPGSSQHAVLSLRHPRWEDYDYEREPEYDHPMAWLGDGHIPVDVDPGFYYDDLRSRMAQTSFFTD
ncbi:FAD/NAD(P)-binding domain-containing protein [Cutaneotrichosporon oleaginosum]|uniref:FAD/NAD(P)-binding domain-containing protein n=1 Tax=Cutaneotrichosporon oleaginosum TaxID=879819 RepID=A0A0J0XSY2_9TREE|nr:FAD/NAD(P)-binding domain-containing protein [Cutaneotrichosporon oleaginosum]KLT44182.1 FAD/NAD(P)-binding domain-containing protein [Cutaneotrichosporon oleaginosum]TXT11649.1 hypothetical protein COLE_02059 [Cutaneotrichosporon oleaginosum]